MTKDRKKNMSRPVLMVVNTRLQVRTLGEQENALTLFTSHSKKTIKQSLLHYWQTQHNKKSREVNEKQVINQFFAH